MEHEALTGGVIGAAEHPKPGSFLVSWSANTTSRDLITKSPRMDPDRQLHATSFLLPASSAGATVAFRPYDQVAERSSQGSVAGYNAA